MSRNYYVLTAAVISLICFSDHGMFYHGNAPVIGDKPEFLQEESGRTSILPRMEKLPIQREHETTLEIERCA